MEGGRMHALSTQERVDEVLAEVVTERAEGDLAARPAACRGGHEDRVEAVWLVDPLHQAHDPLDDVPVALLARVVREVLELELDRPKLGKYGRLPRPRREGAR